MWRGGHSQRRAPIEAPPGGARIMRVSRVTPTSDRLRATRGAAANSSASRSVQDGRHQGACTRGGVPRRRGRAGALNAVRSQVNYLYGRMK
jgi:hypothetical protein